MLELDNLGYNKNSKRFKEASEFLIKILTLQQNQEDVLVEREVIMGPKISHKVKREVEEVVVTNDPDGPAQDSDEQLAYG